jgi:hypothetical protein
MGRFDFLCAVIRSSSSYPDCLACPPPIDGDTCGNCSCYLLAELDGERAELMRAAEDLHTGKKTTGEIERAYGASLVFRSFEDPAGVARSLFTSFLGRPPEADELANASMIVIGSLLGETAPAGLLFHRHGSTYEDLVDIVFSSEAYRDAAVFAGFRRYLGRPPTPAEQLHFSAALDPQKPDVRDTIRAVVSSREYFDQ